MEKIVREEFCRNKMGFKDLFKTKSEWKHPDWMVRLAALEKFSDQVLLAEITKNDKNTDVSAAAQLRLQELKNKQTK